RTDDRRSTDAATRLAGIAQRTGVAVGALGTVGLGRVGAGAARRIANAGVVALIGSRADDRVAAGARASLAAVAPRAGAAVVARRAVGLGGMWAPTRGRVAGAGVVALIEGVAHDRIGADAGAGQAGVALRAGVAVAARGAVQEGSVRAALRRTAPVLGAGIAVVAARRWTAGAATRAAGVGHRAGVAVVARGGVVRVVASARRVTPLVRAAVVVVAVGSGATDAGAVGAPVRGRAGVAVVAAARVEAGHKAGPGAVAGAVVCARVPVVARRLRRLELAGRRPAVAPRRPTPVP